MSRPLIQWFLRYFFEAPFESADLIISLVKANLANLPPTTIIGAEIDPFKIEGKLLADKSSATGVKTTYKLFKSVTQEFFGMAR